MGVWKNGVVVKDISRYIYGCRSFFLYYFIELVTDTLRAIFFDLQKDVQLDIDGNFILESRCFFVLISSTCGNN